MDIVAHGALGAALFSRSGVLGLMCRRYRIPAERCKGFDWTIAVAFFAGIIPDLFSFGFYAVQRVVNSNYVFGPPGLKTIPSYVFQSYTITHSMLTALAGVLICAILFKSVWPAMLAWPLHILCDIPLHSHAYFPTPFLYPFSDWVVDGFPLVKKLWVAAGYWMIIILICAFVHLHHVVIKWKKRFWAKKSG